MSKKKFVKMALDENFEIFIIHIMDLKAPLSRLLIYLDKKVQIASQITKKIKILDKYSDFADVFSEEKILVLLKKIKLNEYVINLEIDKQIPYRPIYSLDPI